MKCTVRLCHSVVNYTSGRMSTEQITSYDDALNQHYRHLAMWILSKTGFTDTTPECLDYLAEAAYTHAQDTIRKTSYTANAASRTVATCLDVPVSRAWVSQLVASTAPEKVKKKSTSSSSSRKIKKLPYPPLHSYLSTKHVVHPIKESLATRMAVLEQQNVLDKLLAQKLVGNVASDLTAFSGFGGFADYTRS